MGRVDGVAVSEGVPCCDAVRVDDGEREGVGAADIDPETEGVRVAEPEEEALGEALREPLQDCGWRRWGARSC